MSATGVIEYAGNLTSSQKIAIGCAEEQIKELSALIFGALKCLQDPPDEGLHRDDLEGPETLLTMALEKCGPKYLHQIRSGELES